jgi:hypothetical protein
MYQSVPSLRLGAERLGADEEFGPAAPTVIQSATQTAMDLSGLSKNVLIAAVVGFVAYVGYRIYYDE